MIKMMMTKKDKMKGFCKRIGFDMVIFSAGHCLYESQINIARPITLLNSMIC